MNSYISDKEFLEKYYNLIELSFDSKKVLLTPALQGRVMTSTSSNYDGLSFGWINYDLISSGEVLPNVNNWGGEDRFWLGPEGGQYALFFPPETSREFKFEDWKAPSIIDTDSWELVSTTSTEAKFTTSQTLVNYSGNKFNFKLDRSVSILTDQQISDALGIEIDANLESVGYVSQNCVTNIGQNSWKKETGAISIWVLGQFNPSDDNQIILPVKESSETEINDYYFGKIPSDRLERRGNCYYFKGDGDYRAKLGIPPEMTIPTVMSLDQINGVLTVVKFSFNPSAKDYVNSLWAYQDEPFKGDVINSYNDGAIGDAEKFGGFYEIESSSEALFLSPNQSHTHSSTTIHIKGDVAVLKQLLDKLA